MIRPADRAGDDDALWSLLEPAFRAGETYALTRDIPRAAALAFWRDGHEVFLAEEAGAALGTAYLGPNRPGGGDHVANAGFVTAAQARGRGVARALLAHVLAMATARGFRAMAFNFVVESNARAIRLWRAHGFDIVGRLPQAFRLPDGRLVDALVMHRRLVP